MADVVKVYKVKNTTTGLYRTAGGSWTRSGKTWNSLAHLKSSLASQGWYRDNEQALPDPEIQVIEIVVQEVVGSMTPMADLVQKERRSRDLTKRYGGSFSDLVGRIERDGQQEDWRWCLLTPFDFRLSKGWQEVFLEELKKQNLRQNRDFRKAASRGLAVAFRNKRDAMMVRLALPSDMRVVSLDIRDFVETDLDGTDQSAV